MKRKLVILSLILALISLPLLACAKPAPAPAPAPTPTPAPAPAPDKIKVGYTLSFAGPYAIGSVILRTNYEMWIEEVNAAGGLYVPEFDKRIPIEKIEYDDSSDIGTAVSNIEKLILEEKVDILFSPLGTAMGFATAPVVTKYGYPVMNSTLSSERLREVAHTVPYFFGILNMPREQGAALVDLLVELGVKTVALIYLADAYGIEWAAEVAPALGIAGIDTVILKSYPLGVKDLSPLLKEVQAANVDALLAMSYPGDTFLITGQAIGLGLNPKVFFLGVGVAVPAYRDAFGVAGVEGIMGPGVWNKNVSYPGAREYFDRYLKRWDQEPDRWASAFTWASLQIWEEVIAKVGLDREKQREMLATETFSTIIGPVNFEGGFNLQAPGEIGQWQNGEFEIVAAKEKRTAEPIFPKPEWPKE